MAAMPPRPAGEAADRDDGTVKMQRQIKRLKGTPENRNGFAVELGNKGYPRRASLCLPHNLFSLSA